VAAEATAGVGFTPKPLPFGPGAIVGLSDKLLTSHHDNNYVGAVKRLGAIETAIGALDPATAPVFTLNGLKREELIAWNSMILHELYFANLGAPSRPGAGLAEAMTRDFGSVDRWAAQFAAMSKALGGGSGWVILTWSHRDRRLMTSGRPTTRCRWPRPRRSWCSTCTSTPTRSIMGQKQQLTSMPSWQRSTGAPPTNATAAPPHEHPGPAVATYSLSALS
jgi:hypothetical protein